MPKLFFQEKTKIIGMHPNRRNCARVIVDYLNAERDSEDRPKRDIGVWELVGLTGKWAQVIGVYEFVDNWNGFNAFTKQIMRSPPPELASTYAAIESFRSGGDNELLEALEGSPDDDAIEAMTTDAPLLVHDTFQVEPGAEQGYGEALLQELKPIADGHDQRLIGLYRGALSDGLVIAMWATSLDRYAALQRAGEARAWHAHAAGTRHAWRQELWTAAPGSRFADPSMDYGDADIRAAGMAATPTALLP